MDGLVFICLGWGWKPVYNFFIEIPLSSVVCSACFLYFSTTTAVSHFHRVGQRGRGVIVGVQKIQSDGPNDDAAWIGIRDGLGRIGYVLT